VLFENTKSRRKLERSVMVSCLQPIHPDSAWCTKIFGKSFGFASAGLAIPQICRQGYQSFILITLMLGLERVQAAALADQDSFRQHPMDFPITFRLDL
jgi:hypothetical protein